MNTTRLLSVTALLFALAPSALAAAAPDSCSFSDTFAYRSGALPYGGTLDEQVAASMDNIFATSTQSRIDYMFSIGKHPSVRIIAKDGDKTIREYHYVNKGTSSYQFNISATPETYAKQKQNLRKLLRDPFGPQLRLSK